MIYSKLLTRFKHSPAAVAAVIVKTWKNVKWPKSPPPQLACDRRRISGCRFLSTHLSGSCVVFVRGHAATIHERFSLVPIKKQTKTKLEKQILVFTVVFCFVAFQTFFDSIKLCFICEFRSRGTLLPRKRGCLFACHTSKGNPVTFGGPFGGSLSKDDDDGSKNVAKKWVKALSRLFGPAQFISCGWMEAKEEGSVCQENIKLRVSTNHPRLLRGDHSGEKEWRDDSFQVAEEFGP